MNTRFRNNGRRNARANPVVFCDFDGTIADEEAFVAVLYHFAPKLAAELVPGMQQRRITLREGVPPILESIPSARYPEILEFMKGRKIRAGFGDLLDFLEKEGVPLVIGVGQSTRPAMTDATRLVQPESTTARENAAELTAM